MTACIIPVKTLSGALSRIGGLIDQIGKKELSLAMLEDVLEAVMSIGTLKPIVIVTRDPQAQALAKDASLEIIQEPINTKGEGPAVDFGTSQLVGRGITRVLILPSDVPQVTPEDLMAILNSDEGDRSIVMAPAHDGGTNAILKQPPDIIPSSFGINSLSLHIKDARARNVSHKTMCLDSLYVDVDTPEDLKTVLTLDGANRTKDVAVKLDLHKKLQTALPSKKRIPPEIVE